MKIIKQCILFLMISGSLVNTSLASQSTTGVEKQDENLSEEDKEARTNAFIDALNECYQSINAKYDMSRIKEEILQNNSLTLYLSETQSLNIPHMWRQFYYNLPEDSLQKILPLLKNLIWLKKLTIRSTSIPQISSVLQHTPFIEELELRYNQLTDLPESVKNLIRLKKLDLTNNDFTTLPDFVLQLNHVEMINLSRNPLLEKSYETPDHLKRLGAEDLKKEARIHLTDEIDKDNAFLYDDYDIFWSQLLRYYNGRDISTEFASSVFSDLPGSNDDKTTVSPPLFGAHQVIYNDSGYPNNAITFPADNTIDAKGVHYIRGKPVFLKKGTPVVLDGTKILHNEIVTEDIPIDYTIHLPKGEIKAICVYVYGGIIPIMSPDLKYAREKYLLDHGVALIFLNLVDLSLLNTLIEGKRPFQSEISNEMQAKILGSIHAFWELLKRNPNELLGTHESQILDNFMGKDIFLIGASFGGGIAMRHAEFYPGTFTGYISHDGALSPQAVKIEEHVKAGYTPNLTLIPLQDIQNIEDPILILQNYDDNRVRNNTAIEFAEKAQELGKNVKLLISSRGSATTEKGWSARGHFEPDNPENFDLYAKTILSFITSKGQSIAPAISKWRLTEGKLYAHKEYQKASFKDKFLSYAYRRHVYHNTPNKTILHAWWSIFSNNEITDSSIYDALAYVDAMKQDPKLYTEFKQKIERSPELLSDTALNNTLKSYIPLFVDYLVAKIPPLADTPSDKFIEFYEDSSEIKDILRKKILTEFDPFVLTYLFLSNPDLCIDYSRQISQDPIKNAEKEKAFLELQEEIKKINIHIRDTWKETLKAVREKIKSGK